jgi:hypothetical protein
MTRMAFSMASFRESAQIVEGWHSGERLHKSDPSSVLVLFDGRKEPSRLYWTYVERIDHSAMGHN